MRRIDLPLAALTAALTVFGLLMLYSSSAYAAARDAGDPLYYVIRQGVGVGLGVALAAGLALTPYGRLGRWAPALYAFAVVALLMVWLPGIGHGAKGAQRWFGFGGFHIQPAEFARVAVLVALATWLHRNRADIHQPAVLGWAVAGVALPLGLIVIQPDFGSTAIIAGLCGVMVVLAGLRWTWAVVGGLGLTALGSVVMVAKAYRLERLMVFLDPTADCKDSGYQVCHSLLALHNGGLLGRGAGESQSKLFYLPEAQNDFIVSVIGEELGILGIAVLLALWAGFVWRGLTVARRAPDLFGALLAGTFTIALTGQAALNIGVALGVVPPKGLVLPFVSYGPSAMIVNLAIVGILLSVSREGVEPAVEPAAAPAAPGLVGRAGA